MSSIKIFKTTLKIPVISVIVGALGLINKYVCDFLAKIHSDLQITEIQKIILNGTAQHSNILLAVDTAIVIIFLMIIIAIIVVTTPTTTITMIDNDYTTSTSNRGCSTMKVLMISVVSL